MPLCLYYDPVQYSPWFKRFDWLAAIMQHIFQHKVISVASLEAAAAAKHRNACKVYEDTTVRQKGINLSVSAEISRRSKDPPPPFFNFFLFADLQLGLFVCKFWCLSLREDESGSAYRYISKQRQHTIHSPEMR